MNGISYHSLVNAHQFEHYLEILRFWCDVTAKRKSMKFYHFEMNFLTSHTGQKEQAKIIYFCSLVKKLFNANVYHNELGGYVTG